MFKALPFIFPLRRLILYSMFSPALSSIKEVFYWASSDTREKGCGSLWPGLGKPLCFLPVQENSTLFCLLREIGFLTLLCMLKTLFLDEHNTNAYDTHTNNHFQQ